MLNRISESFATLVYFKFMKNKCLDTGKHYDADAWENIPLVEAERDLYCLRTGNFQLLITVFFLINDFLVSEMFIRLVPTASAFDFQLLITVFF